MKHIKLFEDYINQEIGEELINLYNILTSSKESKMDELPKMYYYLFSYFLSQTGITTKYQIDSGDISDEEEVIFKWIDGEDRQWKSVSHKKESCDSIKTILWIKEKDKETYFEFSKWIFTKIENDTLPILPEKYPVWSIFEQPEIIKNQWLINFTNEADAIYRQGFTKGVNDIQLLPKTTDLSDEYKPGGYNFAFTISDFPKHWTWMSRYGPQPKYGGKAVIFKAPGIKAWHRGDEEPQVIFLGSTANNIIPLDKDNPRYNWSIKNKNKKILFEDDDLITVVNWAIEHYSDYQKSI